jgi:hypothetical protein
MKVPGGRDAPRSPLPTPSILNQRHFAGASGGFGGGGSRDPDDEDSPSYGSDSPSPEKRKGVRFQEPQSGVRAAPQTEPAKARQRQFFGGRSGGGGGQTGEEDFSHHRHYSFGGEDAKSDSPPQGPVRTASTNGSNAYDNLFAGGSSRAAPVERKSSAAMPYDQGQGQPTPKQSRGDASGLSTFMESTQDLRFEQREQAREQQQRGGQGQPGSMNPFDTIRTGGVFNSNYADGA